MLREFPRFDAVVRLLNAVPGAPLLAILIASVWAAFALSAALSPDDVLTERLQHERTVLREISDLRNALAGLYVECSALTRSHPPVRINRVLGQLQSQQALYIARHVRWSATPLPPPIADLLLRPLHADAIEFLTTAVAEWGPALRTGDTEALRQSMGHLHTTFARLQEDLKRSTDALSSALEKDEQSYQSSLQQAFVVLAISSSTILLALSVHLWRAGRSADDRLDQARRSPGDAAYARQALRLADAGTWRLDFRNSPATRYLSQRTLELTGANLPPTDNGIAVAAWEDAVRNAEDPESADHALQSVAETISGTRSGFDTTFAFRRPLDGRIVWLREVAEMVCDPRGKPLDLFGITIDVTRSKQNEAELLNAKLMAESATRMKSDFMANMSHEIRTPLNAIIGLSYLALNAAQDLRQQDHLEKIHQSGEHLLAIINDILDFSKIEAGMLALEQHPFSLADVLQKVVALLGSKADKKGLELIISVDPTLPVNLIGDGLRLGQVLLNYVNNAIKFTERGSIRIAVYPVHESCDTLQLRFDVRDTGIGLSEAQMDGLFHSFVQVDTSTTRRHGGSGLGLAICKNMAHLMHGQVGVDSSPGCGANFWFTAQLGKGPVPAPSDWPLPDLRGRRVLVVDDNEHARLVLVDMLNGLQFDVEAVDRGAAALDVVRSEHAAGRPYELLFLDWQMPEMDGLQVAHFIASMALKPPPHLIMVTAYGRAEVAKAAAAGGIQEVLTKPITAAQLSETVYRCLRQHDRQQPVVPSARSSQEVDWSPQLETLAGCRILLVEDNEINQEVAFDFLSGAGFVVGIADSGLSAIQRVREANQHWDLVLMDLHMQGMDGISTTVEIRKWMRAEELPIVALTASVLSADRTRCLEAGMQDFLSKPIIPATLWQTLLQWIKPPSPAQHPANPANLVGPVGPDTPDTL